MVKETNQPKTVDESTNKKKQPSKMVTVDLYNQMGVSKNKGTPKWMVYNGKPS